MRLLNMLHTISLEHPKMSQIRNNFKSFPKVITEYQKCTILSCNNFIFFIANSYLHTEDEQGDGNS